MTKLPIKSKLAKLRAADWRAIIKSYLRTFGVALSVALTALASNKVDEGVSLFSFNFTDLEFIFGAALLSTFAPLIRALDKTDKAFGKGSQQIK